eukprot:2487433-Prymnesium_polylepis.1
MARACAAPTRPLQVERATARLQFWEGLRAGTLPDNLSCAEKLHASGLIQRAEASVRELRAKRRIVVPEGSSADLQAATRPALRAPPSARARGFARGAMAGWLDGWIA